MTRLETMEKTVLHGGQLGREDALRLAEEALEPLCAAADRLRQQFCGDTFDLCTIVNAKSGRCPEDCRYCAQSAFYPTKTEIYPLLGRDALVAQGLAHAEKGAVRYSIVTSGRALSDMEIDRVCESVRELRQKSGLSLCISCGLLSQAQFVRLREAGVTRVHNNLETSRAFFPNVCTTHSYDDKLAAIAAAQRAGLSVCSGGILGLGETMEDRIDMALALRALGVRSVPVNVLNPIPGTPLEHNPPLPYDEVRRTVAVFRFLLPDASIRLAGGRGLLPDKGRACFHSGANAAISGDMLTTAGITLETDRALLQELGYKVGLWNG